MSTLIPNDFSTYDLSDEEALQGALLSPTQVEVIQNDIAIYNMEKVNIEFDVNNPARFAQDEAHVRGKVEALRYRLDCSIAAMEQLEFEAANPQLNQS